MRLSPRQREALKIVSEGRFFPTLAKEDDGWHARWRAIGADNPWVDDYVRAAAMTRLSEDAEDQRHETLHDAWMMALKSRTGLVRWDDAACAAFAAELDEWSGNAEEDVAARRNIVFRFDCADGKFVLSCAVPGGRRGLKALGQAAYVFPPLMGLKSNAAARPRPASPGLRVEMNKSEAEGFLARGARELRNAGYGVEGTDLAAEISAEAEITSPDSGNSVNPAAKRSGDFNLVVKVAGEPVSAAEIRFLLDQGSSLVFFRDRWIEVDVNVLRQALRALEKRGKSAASPLAFALGIGRIGALELERVRTGGALRTLVDTLAANRRAGLQGDASTRLEGLAGELRPYQARGVRWMKFLSDNGFGALLADDMGLGKTIQTIAWILQQPNDQAILIVAPLTLLANWAHEFARFAPALKVFVHQGEDRHVGSGFKRAAAAADVVITSYQLLVRDYRDISEVAWDALVLDEAQTIKNPDTQAARAVRALLPPKRVALTGTPVENSVADIWSIEEFLNPGFLGDRASFAERFARPIAADEHSRAGQRLRRALEPFVLRRIKSDPEIAAELGPKREIKEYCRLADAQRREYELALEEFRTSARARGDVFALLTRLKLICDGEGKLERLDELVGRIFESGESALVFTQYAKVGSGLRDELEKRFGRRFPFLHGGLSAAEREREIRSFTTSRRPNLFILSLKAGGFGLNLTKATHVIHFDRWWNPAVENQATDRAHRIGQAKTVFVHEFITVGTLEEHVDEILERKARVAGSVITEQEWLEAAKLDE